MGRIIISRDLALQGQQPLGSAKPESNDSKPQVFSSLIAKAVGDARTPPEQAAAPAAAHKDASTDVFGRTPEEAREQVSEWQQQEEAVDAVRRQMGLPPINRGYSEAYNSQNLDLKTMQPRGWAPVDSTALAREQSIKDAIQFVNDTRQFNGKPIIEAFGFTRDVVEEARRRAGSTPGS
jgi:hypothetical protein